MRHHPAFKRAFAVACLLCAAAYFGKMLITERARQQRNARVFHVPGCPQYNAVSTANVREFPTVADAVAADYTPAANCLDEIETRRAIETETDDAVRSPEHPMN